MLSASPPPPPYAAAFDAFDQGLEKPFDDFSSHFGFEQVCGGDAMSINSDAIYSAFGGPHHQMNPSLAHLDVDLAAFMTAIPQFAT